jgi:hypothetical protein
MLRTVCPVILTEKLSRLVEIVLILQLNEMIH